MKKLSLVFSLLIFLATCVVSCTSEYTCRYYIEDICFGKSDNWGYLDFSLGENEILNGKITVDENFCEVVFCYSEPDLKHVTEAMEDPVIISPMHEYTFAIQAKEPAIVRCFFLYRYWPVVLGDFLCNIEPFSYGAQGTSSSSTPWDGPQKHTPPKELSFWIFMPAFMGGFIFLAFVPSWIGRLVDKIKNSKKLKQ